MSPDSFEPSFEPSLKKQQLPDISPDFAQVTTAYEKNIGALTPMVSDTFKDWLKEYPCQWILDAIQEAVKHEKRSIAYMQPILKRWRQQGRGTNGHQPPPKVAPKGSPAPAATPEPTPEEIAGRVAAIRMNLEKLKPKQEKDSA